MHRHSPPLPAGRTPGARLSLSGLLLGLLVATSAQAQVLSVGDKDLGKPVMGSAYSGTFDLWMNNGSATVYVSVRTPSGSTTTVTSIKPNEVYIQSEGYASVTVNGVTPNVEGQFEENIVFTWNTAYGWKSLERRIYGYAVKGSTSSPPPDATYWVGVIPEANGCPPGVDLITVYMDDEDSRNINKRSGWIGSWTSDSNTTMRFCRVDGRQFKPVANSIWPEHHYAVLRLGNTCPEGSVPFYRRFQNETWNNRNWYSSSGNKYDIPYSIQPYKSVTDLHFCLFRSGSSTMSAFPNLGFPYGVFAAGDFSKALQTGWVFTDDNDGEDCNGNKFEGNEDGKRIVTPMDTCGKNTQMNLARVTSETRPVARCTVDPSSGVDWVYANFSDAGSYARAGRVLTNYSWSFSDDSVASGPGPHGRGFGVGNHYGILTVTDSAGETGWAECFVYVSSSGDCNFGECPIY